MSYLLFLLGTTFFYFFCVLLIDQLCWLFFFQLWDGPYLVKWFRCELVIFQIWLGSDITYTKEIMLKKNSKMVKMSCLRHYWLFNLTCTFSWETNQIEWNPLSWLKLKGQSISFPMNSSQLQRELCYCYCRSGRCIF